MKSKSYKRNVDEVEDSEDITHRKRVAHPSAVNAMRPSGPSSQPKKVANVHQKLYDRWRLFKAAAAEKAAEYVPEEVKPSESSRFETESSTQPAEPSSSTRTDSQINGNGKTFI